MLHIILLILKIIGWILLVILGLLVLLVCIVLFTPFRYEIYGNCKGKISSLGLRIRFSYFLHLISGTARYEDERFIWNLRVAWKKMSSDETASEVMKEAETETMELAEAGIKEVKKKTEIVSVEGERETSSEKVEQSARSSERKFNQNEQPHHKKAEPEKQKSSLNLEGSGKQDHFLDKLESFFEKTAYKFRKICDKIKEIIRKKEIVMGFLTSEIHQTAFCKIISELKRLLLHLKPKKIKGEVEFGFEDPALTGQVTAGVSILYPYFSDYVQIDPRFEEKILKGHLYSKGRVAPIIFASFGLRLLLDKNIRFTIRDIKNFRFDS